MGQNRKTYIALSVLLSIVLLGLLFSQIEVKDIIDILRRISVPGLVLYAAGALAGAGLRAWRYKIFLSPSRISWPNILMATFIRNSFVDLLPARLGSLTFIYVLNRRLKFSFEAATSAFVASFVYDFLTLGPFVGTALIIVGSGQSVISSPALLAAAVVFFLIWLLILWKLAACFAVFAGLCGFLAKALKLEDNERIGKAVRKLDAVTLGLRQIQDKKRNFQIFALSLLVRAAKYASVYILLWALLKSQGPAWASFGFWKFILGITGAELTSALPIKGIAGFGTWESAWALAFRLMNLEPRLAVISGIGVHLLTNIFEYALGIGSLLILAAPLVKKTEPGGGQTSA